MAHVEIGPVIFQFIEEWSQFFEPCNWRTFHPVMFEAEDDGLLGGFEVTAILMGLGLRVRWDHSDTEFKDKLIKKVNDIKKSTMADPTMARAYCMCRRKCWHIDVPPGWTETHWERFDLVECGIYEKPIADLTPEDREFWDSYRSLPRDWVEPSENPAQETPHG